MGFWFECCIFRGSGFVFILVSCKGDLVVKMIEIRLNFRSKEDYKNYLFVYILFGSFMIF